MEAMISESLFEKQKSSFDMLNRNWVFILIKIHLKFVISIKTSAIQSFKELEVDILYNCSFLTHNFSIAVVKYFPVAL